MNGGTFTAGSSSYSGPANISIGPASGSSFYGLSFQGCTVNIYNTTFGGLANDTTYAVSCIDCPSIDIRNNVFNCNDNNNNNDIIKGGINITFYNSDLEPVIYIGENTFNLYNSTLPAVSLMSYAGVTCPVLLENNIFNGNGLSGQIGIIMSGIVGGAVK